MKARKQDGGREVLFIGDSLIEYFDWGGRFPTVRVSNLGVSGETAEGLLRRLDRITGSHPGAGAVFIMTGINNLAMGDMGFLDTYGKLLARLKSAYPGGRIFINSLLPTLLPWISPADIMNANAVLRRIAEETGCGFLDVHSVFERVGLRQCLLEDGIHLSGRGYEVWSSEVEKAIS